MEDLVFWLAALGIGALVLVLGTVIAAVGDPAVAPLTRALEWLADTWPFAPAYAPYFAFAAILILQRLALAPYALTHTPVDRTTGRVRRRAGGSGFLKQLGMTAVLRIVTDCALLLVLTRAALLPGWFSGPVTALPNVRWMGEGVNAIALGIFDILGASAVAVAAHVVVPWANRKLAAADGPRAAERGAKRPGFISARAGEDLQLPPILEILLAVFVYWPLYVYLAMRGENHPFLGALLVTFVVVRLAAVVVFETVSLAIDMNTDRWIFRLIDEAREHADPERRIEAIESLAPLAQEDLALRDAIRQLSWSGPPAVRAAAEAALQKR